MLKLVLLLALVVGCVPGGDGSTCRVTSDETVCLAPPLTETR